MHKKDAPDADQVLLDAMEKMHYTDSVFIVCNVIERLSGKRSTTVLHDVNIGLNCGSRRAVL